MAQVMLAMPMGSRIHPPSRTSSKPTTNAAPSTSQVAASIVRGAISPAATARRGPTRAGVSAPCTKSK